MFWCSFTIVAVRLSIFVAVVVTKHQSFIQFSTFTQNSGNRETYSVAIHVFILFPFFSFFCLLINYRHAAQPESYSVVFSSYFPHQPKSADRVSFFPSSTEHSSLPQHKKAVTITFPQISANNHEIVMVGFKYSKCGSSAHASWSRPM